MVRVKLACAKILSCLPSQRVCATAHLPLLVEFADPSVSKNWHAMASFEKINARIFFDKYQEVMHSREQTSRMRNIHDAVIFEAAPTSMST